VKKLFCIFLWKAKNLQTVILSKGTFARFAEICRFFSADFKFIKIFILFFKDAGICRRDLLPLHPVTGIDPSLSNKT